MLPRVEHLSAAIAACAFLAGCAGAGGSVTPSGGPLLASTNERSRAVAEQLVRAVECKPLEAPLRGQGGVYAFRSVNGLRVRLPYAASSLGKNGSQNGYIESCGQSLGGNTPGVPAGTTLDWEGIVSTDGTVGVTFLDAKQNMTFSGSALSPFAHYTLFVFEADRQYVWQYAQTIPLGTPVNHTLSTPSPFENGYDLAGTGVFFILTH
jgi:hypothetical protein